MMKFLISEKIIQMFQTTNQLGILRRKIVQYNSGKQLKDCVAEAGATSSYHS